MGTHTPFPRTVFDGQNVSSRIEDHFPILGTAPFRRKGARRASAAWHQVPVQLPLAGVQGADAADSVVPCKPVVVQNSVAALTVVLAPSARSPTL